MVRNDKKSLVFSVNLGDRMKDRVAYERDGNIIKLLLKK